MSALAVAGTVALWGSAGVISVSLLPFLHIYYINYDSLTHSLHLHLMKQAIDRLPLIPGVLELVGIGYTGVRT